MSNLCKDCKYFEQRQLSDRCANPLYFEKGDGVYSDIYKPFALRARQNCKGWNFEPKPVVPTFFQKLFRSKQV